MVDWAPVVVGTVLFALLSPGLLVELPGTYHTVEFGSFRTNCRAVITHAVFFFAIFTLIIVVLHLHIYAAA